MEANEITCIPVLSNGIWHLLPVDMLEAVVAGPMIVKVPEAPEEIIGISIHEGQLITYYYLQEGKPDIWQRECPRCGMIIRTKGGRRGIVADDIAEQKTVDEKEYLSLMTERLAKILGE